MAVFEESTYSNLTNVTEIFDVASDFTDGTIGLGIWILITFGTYFLLAKYGDKEAMIASGFVSIISAILLAYVGLLAGNFIMIAFVIFTISLLVMIIFKNLGGV